MGLLMLFSSAFRPAFSPGTDETGAKSALDNNTVLGSPLVAGRRGLFTRQVDDTDSCETLRV